MDLWKIQLFIFTFCSVMQIYVGMSFTLDEEGGQDLSLDTGLTEAVDALMKRSKALRFYGLMGKRSGNDKPIKVDRSKKKGEMFVGLMGRSMPGSQEEWVQII
ncbi:uncharacterized protein si:ch211-131k2.2 [Boleophthalmus pectinirostris]|uniref:uncharacterized protein si:ch211-131k2.2 n=1 Tax=Boleophthalmus pectinirostris TaxID=150288 RepID=UPI00242F9B30|nr:uncharacterized protein si:ch211-131k2.2 [Boleophthalmus pectinirostris]